MYWSSFVVVAAIIIILLNSQSKLKTLWSSCSPLLLSPPPSPESPFYNVFFLLTQQLFFFHETTDVKKSSSTDWRAAIILPMLLRRRLLFSFLFSRSLCLVSLLFHLFLYICLFLVVSHRSRRCRTHSVFINFSKCHKQGWEMSVCHSKLHPWPKWLVKYLQHFSSKNSTNCGLYLLCTPADFISQLQLTAVACCRKRREKDLINIFSQSKIIHTLLRSFAYRLLSWLETVVLPVVQIVSISIFAPCLLSELVIPSSRADFTSNHPITSTHTRELLSD